MAETALVTGATGFIGSALLRRLLNDGWRVHALVRSDSIMKDRGAALTVHRTDGSSKTIREAMAAAQPDCVFHLASMYLAQHTPDQIADLIQSNVTFGVQLAEASVEAGVSRFINIGTAWQHFEKAEYGPTNLYAATKQAFQDTLRYFHDAAGLRCLTLKLYDTYGAGDTRRKLMQILIDAARSGEPLAMSPGEQLVDLTHVEDVVDALLAAARQVELEPEGWGEYLLSGERFSVRGLAALVESALGVPVRAEFGGRPYRPREVMNPVEAPQSLPNWRRSVSVEGYLAAMRHA